VQILPYRAVPYLVAAGGNFESNANDFGPETVSGIGFARGNSTTSGKNGVASGSFAWVTGLTGNYADNNEARLYTPNYNFTATGTYTLRFKVKNKFEIGYDGYILEYSLNLGNSWTKLGASVQTGWYDFANSSGQTAFPTNEPFFNATNSAYATKQYNVSFLAGNSKVCFRWVFKSDGGVTDVGMALDDFEILGPANGALPVALKLFSGTRISDKVISLNWQTSSEQNNKGFSVEKSLDGKHFFEIGFVAGKGQSNALIAYQFQDSDAEQDQLYYRLNQIDVNKKSEYSKVILIYKELENEKLFNFGYSIGTSELLIKGTEQNMQLFIWNQGGQLIEQIKFNNKENRLPLQTLPKGIYLLEMRGLNGRKQVEKLIWMGQ
jgi:hypothetical protein